jgi:hypothetical protein
MLLGVAFYSIMIGILSSIFTDRQTKESLIAKRTADLDILCKNMKINKEVLEDLKHAVENAASKTPYHWLDPSLTLFHELPMRIKYDFLQSIYKDLIMQCPFFNSFDISFVIRMVPLLKPHFLKTGSILWNEGDYSRYSK